MSKKVQFGIVLAALAYGGLIVANTHVYSGLNAGVAFGPEACNVGVEWKGTHAGFAYCGPIFAQLGVSG